MPRLPIPGQDNGTWGDILNEYLSQSLKPDGTIQDNAVTANSLAPNSVTNSALASNAVTAASIADGSITNMLIADDTIQEAKLSSAVQTKLNQTAPVTSVASKTGAVVLDKSDVGLADVDNTSDVTKNSAIATLTNKTLASPKVSLGLYDSTHSTKVFGIYGTTGGVNNLYVSSTSTGFSPFIKPEGTDANISVSIASKGNGEIRLQDGSWANILRITPVASGVNYIRVTNSATTVSPSITADGTDADVNLDLGAKGAGAVRIGGAPVVTTTATQAITNKTLTSPRVNTILDTNGATALTLSAVTSAVNSLYISNNATGGTPHIKAQGSDANINVAIAPKGAGNIRLQDTNWVSILIAGGVTGAVNYLHVYNAVTTAAPTIQALGADTNINVNFQPKGTGVATVNGIEIATLSGAQTLTNKTLTNPRVNSILDNNGAAVWGLSSAPSAVNNLYTGNVIAGGSPYIKAQGSDTNIGVVLSPKGTGAIGIQDGNWVNIIRAQGVTGAANYINVTNAATGAAPIIAAMGTDTNVGLSLAGKGTGGVGLPTGNPLILYNTLDQTTNYERLRIYWPSNVATIATELGGTGTSRNLALVAGNQVLTLGNVSSTDGAKMTRNATTIANIFTIATTSTGLVSSSGIQTALKLSPTITQTATAGYTALLINPTETTTGSGAKLLADLQVGGVSKMRIDNTGKMTTIADSITISTSKTPVSASAPGTTGDIAWDADYMYVCVATNTWKRSALSLW